jgi:hypothetical protein
VSRREEISSEVGGTPEGPFATTVGTVRSNCPSLQGLRFSVVCFPISLFDIDSRSSILCFSGMSRIGLNRRICAARFSETQKTRNRTKRNTKRGEFFYFLDHSPLFVFLFVLFRVFWVSENRAAHILRLRYREANDGKAKPLKRGAIRPNGR